MAGGSGLGGGGVVSGGVGSASASGVGNVRVAHLTPALPTVSSSSGKSRGSPG